ncbi:sacsin-like [Mercenaria mercenaria]|uniref:sacsin-like n=1 Tax=Mercenaria mercenaria TaxID=6596 RepID=UPI00234F1405|nr:sacsin-like [Mercenaria mercenaria]
MGDSADSDVEENLGILQPTILEHIKKILREYRNDVQIIKELVQNADDAGASEMKILYQGKCINPEVDGETKFRKFLRAPALVFYNDAVFSEKDWKGVRSIYTSEKAHDPLKIGRFGLGFKSVFHMTDYPTILSGDKIMFINPKEQDQNKVCTTINLKKLKRSKNLKVSDFLKVFENTFDFKEEILEDGEYPATIFWFPLRQKTSQLSDTIYSQSEVIELLDSFIEESDKNILFAKTVSKIQVFIERSEVEEMNGTQEGCMDELNESKQHLYKASVWNQAAVYTVEINNENGNLKAERRKLNEKLQTMGKSVPDTTEHWTTDAVVTSTKILNNGETKESKSRWLIVNYLKGGELSDHIQMLLKDENLCYHHFVGLAARIKEEDTEEYTTDTGRVFCYQPLPQENHTGLPIYINALFALGNNRRQIKWEDKDSFGMHTDKEIEWNHALVSEILPFGYHLLFQEMINRSKRNDNKKHCVASVYSIVPDIQNTDERWIELGKKFLQQAGKDKQFFTRNEGGHWLPASEITLLSEDETCVDTITKLLTEEQMNFAIIPRNVIASLPHLTEKINQISPEFLGNHMLSNTSYMELSCQQKEHLLQYITSESFPDMILNNLELLPLADGSFTFFEGTETIFLEHAEVLELFPGMLSKFVSTNLLPETSVIIQKVADAGTHRIKSLDAESAAHMLDSVLTENLGTGTLLTLHMSDVSKWKQWLENVWKFIQFRYRESISVFASLPMFPFSVKPNWETANEIELCSLSSLMMYFPQCEDQTEAESVSHAFELLSINIVRNVPDFINTALIDTYITDDKSSKLVQLFERIGTKEIDKFNTNVDDSSHNIALLTYVSNILHTELTPQSLNVLKQIRLFKQVKSTFDDGFDLVSINENYTLCRGHQFPVKLYKPMILISSDTELTLAAKLGAEILDEKQLNIRTLQNSFHYTPAEKQRFILWLLKQPGMVENREIIQTAKRIKFLQSEDGEWKEPSALFDPKDELLTKLFKNEGVFPKLSGNEDELILQGLKHLGLKTRADIKPMDITRTSENINRSSRENKNENVRKAEALLEFLNGNEELIDQAFLCDKRIIPIKHVGPDNYPESIMLKARSCDCRLVLPSEVKSSQYIHLIGSVYYTIDCTVVQNVADKLGWTQPPKVNDVITHFKNVIDSYNVTKKSACLQMISKIYEWLAECTQQRDDVVTRILQNFQKPNDQFIWNGDEFVSPDDIYIDSLEGNYEDLHPFMSKLPTELQHLSGLFSDLGCARCPNSNMFVKALGRIKLATEGQHGNRRQTSLRKMAITILNKLKDDYLQEVSTSDLFCPVYQNNSSDVVMKPVNECVYFEAGEFDNSFSLTRNAVPIHPDVPMQTAKAIGVPNLTQKMLSESDFFESWGQEEPLVMRIRNIIKHGYEDGFTVVKELFQNADDAGASQCYIMYDERENNEASTTLISERMSECQGPAFWVYNDALFSEQDFVNIRKLGKGTKRDDAEKIGEFGQGFCAVYNLTDVPSILSGSNLIMFDPHTTFLETALPKGSPGVRIDLKERNAEVLRTFTDQFKPYENVFGCKILSDPSPYFHGTLFRLPLRTKESEISDTVYTKSAAKHLMDSVMKLASNLFLFNQNTLSIRLYHLPKSVSDPSGAKLVFEVGAHKQGVAVVPDTHQRKTVLHEVNKQKINKTLESRPLKQLQEVNITTKCWFENDRNESSTVKWLVSWATGTDPVLLTNTYSKHALLPLASVAIPFESCTLNPAQKQNKRYRLIDIASLPFFYNTGHFFCFLPTPHKHSFKFHINGKFHLSADRTRLKIKSDDVQNTQETKWNEKLMCDPVISALLFLLESMAMPQKEAFQLWPREEIDDKVLNKSFVETFYSYITSRTSFQVFEHNGNAVSVSQCVFLDPDIREDEEIGDTTFKILDNHHDEYAIDMPRDIYTLLNDSNGSMMKQNTITPERFLVRYFFPKLDCLSSEITNAERNSILRYAINQNIESVNSWLMKNKCIPSDDGSLKKTTEIVDPRSKLAKLVRHAEGYFPETEFVDQDQSLYEKLRALGMRTEELSDDMVLNIVRTITTEERTCIDCAADRSLFLVSYLCDQTELHEKLFNELKEWPFLPVMLKPKDWPFMWHADNLMFQSKRLPLRKGCNDHKALETYLGLERPGSLYTCEFIELVACHRLIVDKNFCDKLQLPEKKLETLFCRLGVHGIICKEQHVHEVVSQLTAITEYNSDIPRDIDMKHATERICEKVYDFLEEFSNSDQVKDFQDKAVIWVRDTFVSPQNVSDDNALVGCQPYLYNAKESSISRCPKLCLSLQILEKLNARDAAEILQRIAVGKKNTPCNETQIHAYVNLLHFLHKCLEKEQMKDLNIILSKEGPVSAIYVPDENCILRDCSTLCLNDSDDVERTATMIYVHELVPLHLAKSLNIKGKKLQRLEETTEDVEDFYQIEPLCSRLRRLVDGFSFDTGIFKELLQNADDAKATEIVFIKDSTSYSTDDIPVETFKPLQGPALCVYNNSAFSKEDLRGITQLGKGSKANDPSKTGKYGVGFNAVYHITDAPSFYTAGEELENGETLCIFDPLARFVPRVSEHKPGKRFKNVQWLRENHADVLKGYHEKRFPNLREKGTMFRFPLRTEPSDIKDDVVDLSELSNILKIFCEELRYSMIFLKYLETVKIYSFDSGEYTEEYTIETKLSDTDLCKRSQFATSQSTMCRDFRDRRGEVFNTRQESVNYRIILRETLVDRCISSSYHVIQTIGFDRAIEIPQLVRVAFDKGDIGLLPQGGIAVCEKKAKRETFGKAFCLLPLPVDTGLPVHVNGHFTLDHETRRSLWKSDHIDSCYRTQWNLTVLNHVIARSYIIYLQILHSVLFESFSDEYFPHTFVKSTLDCFFSHFPLSECASDIYWKELTKNVYSRISTEHLPFMPALQENLAANLKGHSPEFRLSWIPVSSEDDDQYTVYHSCETHAISDKPSFNNILRSVGMKIASVPKKIRDSFENCGLKIDTLSPEHVIDYLSTFDKKEDGKPYVFLNLHVSQTGFQNESNLRKVFEYCVTDNKKFFEKLQDLPIILTQDGILRRLSASSTVFVTEFTDFFRGRHDQFIHKLLAHCLLKVSQKKKKKKREYFTEMSGGLMKRFTVAEFMTLTGSEGLFGMHEQINDPWNQKYPSKALIRIFWDFFKEQLPDCSRKEVSKCLDVINSLHLIPSKEPTSDKRLLLTALDIDTLIDLDSFQRGTKLYEVIKLFGFTELDKSIFDRDQQVRRNDLSLDVARTENVDHDQQIDTNIEAFSVLTISPYKLLLEQIPKFEEPEKCIRCLVRNINKVKRAPLDVAKADLLLKYFSDRANLLQNKDCVEVLKKVPVFVTHSGDITPIDSFDRIVVVPKGLPRSGLRLITEVSNAVLLRDLDVEDLFKILDIDYISVDKVYTELIFPNQHHLTRDQFYDHVDYLCRYVLVEQTTENENILFAMKELQFIETEANIRVRVKDTFYDRPRVRNFFKMFCKEHEMLPKVYHKSHITDVFERLGLQCDMNIKLFERFANEIATDRSLSSIHVQRKSELLVDKLFKMGAYFYQRNDFMGFSFIPFIMPDALKEGLSVIHKPFNSSQRFCFAGSVRDQKDITYTCWTTANILPVWADPVRNNADVFMQKLGICSHPDISLVVNHCEQIGRKLNENLSIMVGYRELITKVMENIYKAISESATRQDQASTLKDVPIIYFPQRDTLKVASSVVIGCSADEEVIPYLQKSPTQYGQFENLFVQLGAEREPDICMYVSVIQTIKRELEGQETSSTQREAVLKAMLNIFMQVRKQTSQIPLKLDSLYLLSDENVLTEARDLVIDNNRYMHNRLKRGIKLKCMTNLEEFSLNRLRMDEIIDCLRKIEKTSRPSLLTEIVKEEVDMSLVSQIESDLAEDVEHFIHNQLFVTSVCRLARHGIRNKLQQQWSVEKEKDVSSWILKIRLKHVKGIRTNLLLNNEVIENTCEAKKVHIQTEGNKTLVYFDITGNSNWYTEVTNCLILKLKEVHGCLVDELLFTAQKVFMCKNPESCEEILDRDGIEAYKSASVTAVNNQNDEEAEGAEREPAHCYSEAERWQRQANRDLDYAHESLTVLTCGTYNWVCYQAHQAAEKSLKAAWFAKDANKIEAIRESHCLVSIAQGKY